MAQAIHRTFRLNTGVTVHAHPDGEPWKAMNRTQAEAKASRLRSEGVEVEEIYRSRAGRVFYVEVRS